MQRLKLEKSRSLLEGSDMPISEIVGQIGFSDNSYFYKIFKKQYGITPFKYRQESTPSSSHVYKG